MNESNMPREWWHEQDQDDEWIRQQEEESLRRLAEEEREAQENNIPIQLELPLYETDIDEGPFMPMRSK